MQPQRFMHVSIVDGKALRILLLVWVVGGSSSGCSKKQIQQSQPVQSPPFTIYMPEGWKQSASGDGMQLVATEPTSAEADARPAVVNVAVERYLGPMTMETNWKLSKESIDQAVGPIEEHESGEKVIDGRRWRWLVYSFPSRTVPGVRMKCLVYSSFKPYYLYAITGGTSVQKFDKYRSVFEQTAETFRFKSPIPQEK